MLSAYFTPYSGAVAVSRLLVLEGDKWNILPQGSLGSVVSSKVLDYML